MVLRSPQGAEIMVFNSLVSRQVIGIVAMGKRVA
jgi:hypothetical protein